MVAFQYPPEECQNSINLKPPPLAIQLPAPSGGEPITIS